MMQNGIVVYAIPPDSEIMMYAIGFSIVVILLSIFVIASIFDKIWARVAGLSIVLIIFTYFLIGQINGAVLTYNQTYKVYHTGGYRTVSGEIKNMKVSEEDALTRLSVGNVQFVLSDDMAGFSQRDFRANQISSTPEKLKNNDFVTIKYVHSPYEWSRAGNKYTILYIKKNGVIPQKEKLPAKIISQVKKHSQDQYVPVLKLWGICLILSVGFYIARRLWKRTKAKHPEKTGGTPDWMTRIYDWAQTIYANYDLKKNMVYPPADDDAQADHTNDEDDED